MRPEPPDEIENVCIAPHPCWEALESCKSLDSIRIPTRPANIPVDAVCIRPVGLYRDRSESPLLDQALGDLGPLSIELVGAMRCLAKQYEASVAYEFQQRIIV